MNSVQTYLTNWFVGANKTFETSGRSTATFAIYDALERLSATYDSTQAAPAVPTWQYRPDGLLGSAQISSDGFHPGRVYRVYDGTQLLFAHYSLEMRKKWV